MHPEMDIFDARPLAAADLKTLMRACLTLGASNKASLALNLTRLLHLDGSLAHSADWEELAWLIREGWHFHERRMEKHPLMAYIPRVRLQKKVEQQASRAVLKTVALLEAMEPRFARIAAGRGGSHPAALPRDQLAPRGTEDAVPMAIADAAAVLESALPVFSRLLGILETLPIDSNILNPAREAWPHLKWHAVEVNIFARFPRPFAAFWHSPRTRFLLLALEHAQVILRQLRAAWLQLESDLDPEFAIAIEH